ncbi:MAG TPA: sialidase family protein [Acidimicrobiales bacterium]|nr:sialidase family protein [Acidimicrobiales bacterium]
MALVALAQGVAGAAPNKAPIGPATQPIQATKGDEDPLRTYSGPYMAVDPSNSNNVVASFADFRSRRCGLMRSTDGGASWRKLEAAPAPQSYPSCISNNSNVFQGPIAFGRNSTLYYGLAGWDIQDRAVGSGGNVNILMARSTDLGDTWQSTIVRNVRGAEGEKVENNRPVGQVAVDSKSGSDDIVYISWQYSTPFVTAPNANPTRAVVAVSTNGGRDFGEPVDIAGPAWADAANRQKAITSPTATTLAPGATTTTLLAPAGSRAAQPDQAANFGGRNPSITVDNKGNAYALWFNTGANVAPGVLTGEWVSVSSDDGKTWSSYQAGPMSPHTGGVGRIAWSPGGGSQGTVHIVSQVNPSTSQQNPTGISSNFDVVHKMSTDGGKTWSEEKTLNDDDPKQMYAQVIPMISVAPNGRVDVAWWDTRSDPGIRGNDVYYSYSNDDGKTWSKNQRISDKTIDRKFGVWGNNFDMSSPPGIASSNEYAIFGWDDTRFSDPNISANAGFGGGVQDIYTSAVQFEVVGGGTSSTVKVVLAAVVGLLIVGLVLLGVSVASKGRLGGTAGRKTVVGKEPASVK